MLNKWELPCYNLYLGYHYPWQLKADLVKQFNPKVLLFGGHKWKRKSIAETRGHKPNTPRTMSTTQTPSKPYQLMLLLQGN